MRHIEDERSREWEEKFILHKNDFLKEDTRDLIYHQYSWNDGREAEKGHKKRHVLWEKKSCKIAFNLTIIIRKHPSTLPSSLTFTFIFTLIISFLSVALGFFFFVGEEQKECHFIMCSNIQTYNLVLIEMCIQHRTINYIYTYTS